MKEICYEGWEYLEDWRVDYFFKKEERERELMVRSKEEDGRVVMEIEGVESDEEMENLLLKWIEWRKWQRERAFAEE